MSRYEYVLIDEDLIDRQSELLRAGRSLILLGARNVGKRYLTSRLWERLGERETFDRAQVFFRGGVEVGVDEGRRLDARGESGEALEWARDALGRAEAAGPGSGRVVLFAHNVDSQPNAEVRSFFKRLRDLADPAIGGGGRRLTVVLTGEVDLGEFIREPSPPFEEAVRFVVRGFGRRNFARFARRYLTALGFPASLDAQRLIRSAYRRTGASTSFLRFLLWEVFDRRAGDLKDGDEAGASPPMSLWGDMDGLAGDYREVFAFTLEAISETLADYYFRYIAGLIDADPRSWSDLERLIRSEAVEVRPDGPPHPLELIGVAYRKNDRLSLRKTLVGDYIRARYTPRRFGDLFARHARSSVEWDNAFLRYDQVTDPMERVRPYRLEDSANTDDMVKALSTELFRAAEGGPECVLRRFATGCRKALGFAEVTRWRCRNREPVVEARRVERWGRWEPVPDEGTDGADLRWDTLDDPRVAEYEAIIERLAREPGFPDAPAVEAEEGCVIAVALPSAHPDLREKVLVGRPGDATIRSSARKGYILRLADDFRVAYDRALKARQLYTQAEFRRTLTAIANDLMGLIGKELFHPREMLDKAAVQILEKTGYGRVIFAVVDPLRRWMMPVVMKPDDPEEDADARHPTAVKSHQVYRLDRLDSWVPSGSSWVVANLKCLVTRDATEDQRVVKAVADKLKIGAATIVPLLDGRDQVVGTLHVERRDGLATTADENEDLVAFGRRLAVALDLTELGQALMESLNAIDEPIILFGPERRALFITKAASERFALGDDLTRLAPRLYLGDEHATLDQLRALEPGVGAEGRADFERRVRTVIERVFDGKASAEEQVRLGPDDRTSTEQYEVRATRLWDWRRHCNENLKERDAGAAVLLRLRPLRPGEGLSLTLGDLLVAETPDEVLDRILGIIELLGFRWARLYKEEEGRLASVKGFGFVSKEVEEAFLAGDYVIAPPAHDDSWEGWSCFEEREPVLFVHDPDRPDRADDETPAGVRRWNCREPGCPEGLRKRPHEHWIDFPLAGRDRRYGKISLGCDEGLTRKAFHDLKSACKLAGSLLDSVARRLAQKEEVGRLYDDALSRGLHGAAAEVNRWFAEMSPALTRYAAARSRLEKALPIDLELTLYREACSEIARASERVSEALGDIWRRARVDPEGSRRAIPADLEGLLDELRKTAPERVRIETLVEVEGSPRADLDAAGFYEALSAAVAAIARKAEQDDPARDLLAPSSATVPDQVTVRVVAETFWREGREWLRLTVCGDGFGDLLEAPLKVGPGRDRPGGSPTIAGLLRRHGGSASLEPGPPGRLILELPRYARRPTEPAGSRGGRS